MWESEAEYPQTEELRALCDASGVRWSAGYFQNGERVATERVTVVGDGAFSLTFEEEDGALTCVDGMSAHEAFAAGVVACVGSVSDNFGRQ